MTLHKRDDGSWWFEGYRDETTGRIVDDAMGVPLGLSYPVEGEPWPSWRPFKKQLTP